MKPTLYLVNVFKFSIINDYCVYNDPGKKPGPIGGR